jgi:colanic acid biosynthesis protein WcaH
VTDLSSFSSVAAAAKEAGHAGKPQKANAGAILEEGDFLDVIRLTPLISITLIVTDGNRRVLLGQRRNRPAQDAWFVPGGRVRKGETLDGAFTRVVRDELGIASMQRSSSRLFGVFEHHYDDNFAGVPDIGTHCVALAYSLTLSGSVPIGRFDQHSGYAWLLPTEVLTRDDVHPNAKTYFR